MRNASKWFLCFRPPSTIEIDDGVDCSTDRVISLIAAARNSNRLKHNKKKKMKKENKKMLSALDSPIPDPNLPPVTSRRSFASVVRAVVFQTSISRKVREVKLRNRSDRFVREPPLDEDSTVGSDRKTPDQIARFAVDLKSNSNQVPEHDCCFTSTTVEGAEQSEVGGGSGEKINPVAFLVLLSLLVTVFCGRLCAVMTTTVWIYAWRSGALVVGLGEISRLSRKGKQHFSCKRKAID